MCSILAFKYAWEAQVQRPAPLLAACNSLWQAEMGFGWTGLNAALSGTHI